MELMPERKRKKFWEDHGLFYFNSDKDNALDMGDSK